MPKKIFLSKDPQKLWCTASSRVDQFVLRLRSCPCSLCSRSELELATGASRMMQTTTGYGVASPCRPATSASLGKANEAWTRTYRDEPQWPVRTFRLFALRTTDDANNDKNEPTALLGSATASPKQGPTKLTCGTYDFVGRVGRASLCQLRDTRAYAMRDFAIVGFASFANEATRQSPVQVRWPASPCLATYGFAETSQASPMNVRLCSASPYKDVVDYVGKVDYVKVASEAKPANYYNQNVDKKTTKKILSWFLDNYGPSRTSEFLEELKSVGFHYATEAGVSLGFDDLKIPARKNVILNQAEKQIYSTEKKFTHGRITAVERYQKVIDIWTTASENLKDEVISNFKSTDLFNPLYMMAFSGARGNISQVRQLVGMRGLMSDSAGGIIDFPIRANFREGLTITEYVISCYGARKGLIDTALRTADSGYLTRRLVDVAHGIMIGSIECGTTESFPIYPLKSPDSDAILLSLEKRIIGRVNASNNEEISPLTAYDLTRDMVSGSAPSRPTTLGEAWTSIKHELPSSINIRSPLTCGFQVRSLAEPQSLATAPPTKPTCSSSPATSTLPCEAGTKPTYANEPKSPGYAIDKNEQRQERSLAWRSETTSVDRRQTIRSLSLAMPSQSPAMRSQSDGQSEDICQLCYGWSLAHSRLVSIGEAVGVLAAQSIGEPGTQLTMRTFHTGGIFSTDIDAKIFAPHDGYISFPDIDFQGSNSRESTQSTNATKSILRGHKIRTFFGETAFFLFYPIQLKIYSLAGNGVASHGKANEVSRPFQFASRTGSAMRTYGFAETRAIDLAQPQSPVPVRQATYGFAETNQASLHSRSETWNNIVDAGRAEPTYGSAEDRDVVDYPAMPSEAQVDRDAQFSLLSIPAQSLIFVYPGQKVYKNTLCAEITHFIQAKLENPEAVLGESTMSSRAEPTPHGPAISLAGSTPSIGEAVQATPNKTKPSNSLEMLTLAKPTTMLPETLPSSVTKKVLSDIEGQIQLCPFYQMFGEASRQRLGGAEQGVAGHTKQFIAEQDDSNDSIVSSTRQSQTKPNIRHVKGTGSLWVLYGQSLSLSGPCYTGDFFTKNLGLSKPYHLIMTHLPRATMSSESSFQAMAEQDEASSEVKPVLLAKGPFRMAERGMEASLHSRSEKGREWTRANERTALLGSATALLGSAIQGPTNITNSWFIKWIRSLAKPAIELRADSFGVANFARLRKAKPTKPSLRTALANDVPRFRSTKLLSTPSTMLFAGHVGSALVLGKAVRVARSTQSPGSAYGSASFAEPVRVANKGFVGGAVAGVDKNEQGLGDGLRTGPVFMATGETHFVRPALSAMFIGSALKQQANIYGVETLLAEPGMASTITPKPKSGNWPRLSNKLFGEIRSTGYAGEAMRRNSNSLLLQANDVTRTTSLSLTSSSLPFRTFPSSRSEQADEADELGELDDADEVTAEAYMPPTDKTKQGYVKQSRNYAGVAGVGRKVIESGLIVEKTHLRQWNIVPSQAAPSDAGRAEPTYGSAEDRDRAGRTSYVWVLPGSATALPKQGAKQGPSETKKPIQNQTTLKIGECIRFDKMSQIIIRMNSSRGAILRTACRLRTSRPATPSTRTEPGMAKPAHKGAFSIISRKIHPYLISNNSILAVRNGEKVTQRQLLFELVFEKSKTGDIVQGLPKIEQLFEARRTSIHVLNTIHEQLRLKHIEFTRIFEPIEAARRAIRFIQRILVDEIQIVYQSQGVDISDKHIEIIVRQMTSKVIISDKGTTSFYPDDIIDFKSITSLFQISSAPSDLSRMAERGLQAPESTSSSSPGSSRPFAERTTTRANEPGFANEQRQGKATSPVPVRQATYGFAETNQASPTNNDWCEAGLRRMPTYGPVDSTGLHFEPTVLGITKRAFLSDSWASSASFQEAKKVLMESALESKIDFLYGLKSNLIVGRYIRAGTSFQ